MLKAVGKCRMDTYSPSTELLIKNNKLMYKGRLSIQKKVVLDVLQTYSAVVLGGLSI
jgi:hypothetical protein